MQVGKIDHHFGAAVAGCTHRKGGMPSNLGKSLSRVVALRSVAIPIPTR